MFKSLRLVLIVLCLLSPTGSSLAIEEGNAAQPLAGKIIGVGDGDSLTVDQSGQKVKVRLGCIDAPELQQKPYGEAARNRLKALLPPGTVVDLRAIATDRYGRTVAEVFKGGQSINLIMVQEGQAVIYRRYFEGCQASQAQFEQAEARAKQRKLAFWQQANLVMPWDFRQRKTLAPSPKPSSVAKTAKCHPAYPDLCLPLNGPDLDCKDVPARRFRVLSPDPYGFDRDRDGIGCEGK